MCSYYKDKLAADRLRRCYELATPRVRQYLKSEIDFVVDNISPGDNLLELGCGYGRVLSVLAEKAGLTCGIDNSVTSLRAAREYLNGINNCHLICMDALRLAFGGDSFDAVICIQNGISAFQVDQGVLVSEALRVTRPGGKILFSTYSDRFWNDRLEWFRLQSEAGLVGEIDWEKTCNGEIVCRDGFTATTVSASGFMALTSGLEVDAEIKEIDNSSLFCVLTVR